MIHIEQVEIANFRSFKENTHTRDFKNLKNINVITGINNTGKTNVLRAINLFFYPEKIMPEKDMNIIKFRTGGASKFPKISLHFRDEDSFKDEFGKKTTKKYIITCEFQKNLTHKYKIKSYDKQEAQIKKKFENSTKIRNFLNVKFKCVYLSTTDEVIAKQTEKAVKDMILEYYQKKNRDVKESIEKFQRTYSEMTNTLQSHIAEIESSLKDNFRPINNDNLNVSPRLHINMNKDLTEFLIDNLAFQIDDSYSQDITSKGAGIQRSTLILLNIFLLSEIHNNKNKIILLDEPEAFLYPLLIENIKKNLEEQVLNMQNKFQLFLTTHSRTFLNEVNNEQYNYLNIKQESETKTFVRSPNAEDTVKFSVVEPYNDRIKNEVLRNYGLLNELDDYEHIVICEGKTDENYLLKLFEKKDFIPQIRTSDQYNQKEIGRGANSILNILSFLDDVSTIKRNVYILLDGDKEGAMIASKIKKNKYNNIKYNVHVLDSQQNIEDKVFTREQYVERVLKKFREEFKTCKAKFKDIMYQENNLNESVISITKRFIELYKININMNKLKHFLSTDLEHENLMGEDLVDDILRFFKYDEH
ncbi:hypothetical protein L1F34_000419 [Mammaliicoccus lentus]|uniref:ATP-dependent nuclease n=1 Tax=Mammaliicoccus lentus TaxID=42858 RepID=UPI0039ECE0FC